MLETTRQKTDNSIPCEKPGCKCCPIISKKRRATSNQNYNTYPTQGYTCCSTRNIIYLIECTKCTKSNQYVGQTSRPLRTRMNEHRTTSKTKTYLPLYRHFRSKADHDFERDIKVTILQATTRVRLLEQESKWIKNLDTLYPKGLNSRLHNKDQSAKSNKQLNPYHL